MGTLVQENGAINDARGEDNHLYELEFYSEGVLMLLARVARLKERSVSRAGCRVGRARANKISDQRREG